MNAVFRKNSLYFISSKTQYEHGTVPCFIEYRDRGHGDTLQKDSIFMWEILWRSNHSMNVIGVSNEKQSINQSINQLILYHHDHHRFHAPFLL